MPNVYKVGDHVVAAREVNFACTYGPHIKAFITIKPGAVGRVTYERGDSSIVSVRFDEYPQPVTCSELEIKRA